MEECEALCTKIAIMVNAQLVCFGSTQHLKTKFGQGFSLHCRMKTTTEGEPVPMEPLISFIQENFPSAHVFDDKQGYTHFQIPDQNTRLGHIFARMEESKESFGVDDYTVNQTSLEQIFLAFTRNQVPPVKEKRGFWKRFKCKCWITISEEFISHSVTGSPAYMAQEVMLQSERNYDHSSDIVSRGILLLEMWYGIDASNHLLTNMHGKFEEND
ncbi:hypothetical protein CHS0354_030990 [Potamilus streckersoni]|uniref:Protein kinase domain-containing protein n=1 Tax=Potamilus streckersoni TaxID=2493646 RepID=A0AAE0SEV4_9BIVA|nr:hypothetical protein CHS0354_030990 [Potamilus streckersoni]